MQETNKAAILPDDINERTDQKAIISISFSTVDDSVGRIFEPGAPSPTTRLNALKAVVNEGFKAGISMMPTLSCISDTTKSLHEMFTAFRTAVAHYVLPSTITLFGNGIADSRTLVFRAIAKHHPDLIEKYERLLGRNDHL